MAIAAASQEPDIGNMYWIKVWCKSCSLSRGNNEYVYAIFRTISESVDKFHDQTYHLIIPEA